MSEIHIILFKVLLTNFIVWALISLIWDNETKLKNYFHDKYGWSTGKRSQATISWIFGSITIVILIVGIWTT